MRIQKLFSLEAANDMTRKGLDKLAEPVDRPNDWADWSRLMDSLSEVSMAVNVIAVLALFRDAAKASGVASKTYSDSTHLLLGPAFNSHKNVMRIGRAPKLYNASS